MFRVRYELSNGLLVYSRPYHDRAFAERWANLIRLAPGVVSACVQALPADPPGWCRACGQPLLTMPDGELICVDCDAFAVAPEPAAPLTALRRAA
jgi:hypothetical protein